MDNSEISHFAAWLRSNTRRSTLKRRGEGEDGPLEGLAVDGRAINDPPPAAPTAEFRISEKSWILHRNPTARSNSSVQRSIGYDRSPRHHRYRCISRRVGRAV